MEEGVRHNKRSALLVISSTGPFMAKNGEKGSSL